MTLGKVETQPEICSAGGELFTSTSSASQHRSAYIAAWRWGGYEEKDEGRCCWLDSDLEFKNGDIIHLSCRDPGLIQPDVAHPNCTTTSGIIVDTIALVGAAPATFMLCFYSLLCAEIESLFGQPKRNGSDMDFDQWRQRYSPSSTSSAGRLRVIFVVESSSSGRLQKL